MPIRNMIKAIYPYVVWLTVFGLLAAGIGRAQWIEALQGRLVFRGAKAVKVAPEIRPAGPTPTHGPTPLKPILVN